MSARVRDLGDRCGSGRPFIVVDVGDLAVRLAGPLNWRFRPFDGSPRLAPSHVACRPSVARQRRWQLAPQTRGIFETTARVRPRANDEYESILRDLAWRARDADTCLPSESPGMPFSTVDGVTSRRAYESEAGPMSR